MRRRACLLLLLGLAGCATDRDPTLAALDREPAAPPTPAQAPEIASSAPPSPNASPDASANGAENWYVHDVQVASTAPSPIFFLARFDEPPGDGCEQRLMQHARGLGANRLYIHRDAPCAGSAFMVRGEAASGGRDATPNRALMDWVHARWKRPSSISAEQAKQLCVVVQFIVSPLRRVWNVRGQPIRSSGNRAFDDSVRAALESAIDDHATVPVPPRDLIGEHVEYRVEFTEGDPAVCRQP